MDFHVASRVVAINFQFQNGGLCLNCSNKIIKKNSTVASLAPGCVFFSFKILYLG